jgi:hypothetical protein
VELDRNGFQLSCQPPAFVSEYSIMAFPPPGTGVIPSISIITGYALGFFFE